MSDNLTKLAELWQSRREFAAFLRKFPIFALGLAAGVAGAVMGHPWPQDLVFAGLASQIMVSVGLWAFERFLGSRRS